MFSSRISTVSGLLWFYENVRIFCSIFVENVFGILDGDCTEFVDYFRKYGLLNNVNSSIH